MKVINIPIEPLEERYSIQWDRWFLQFFNKEDFLVETIYGEKTSGKINKGSFLDVIETNKYKTSQLKKILDVLGKYDNKQKLVLFFHDLWFPGLETIAYIRNGLGLSNLKICGCLHAGSYDQYDFLNKINMTPWASHMEKGWLSVIADKIFVATEFHKNLVSVARDISFNKIEVTGFPIFDEFSFPLTKKKIVVFPHRLDSEKNPQMFDELAKQLEWTGWNFIKTKDVCKTKQEYYALLSEASIAVSFANQETWGIAMQEAVICNAIPICPDRLSYPELYEEQYLFSTFQNAVKSVSDFINMENDLSSQRISILNKGKEAIPNMIKHIKNL